MGDHPPITPTTNIPQDLNGDALQLYEYISRHFLASISPDSKFNKTTIKFRVAGLLFRAKGTQTIQAGFMEIMHWLKSNDS